MKFTVTFVATGSNPLIEIPSRQVGLVLLDRLRMKYPDIPLSAIDGHVPELYISAEEVEFTEAQARKMLDYFADRNSVKVVVSPGALNDFVELESFIKFDGEGEEAKVTSCGFRYVLNKESVAHHFSHGLIKVVSVTK